MLESYYKILNPYETLEKVMPAIKEAFALFYGDEEREFIEQRFNHVYMYLYQQPENLASMLNTIKMLISKDIKTTFFEKANMKDNEENNQKFFSNYGFDYPILLPINDYLKWLKYFKMSKEEKRTIKKKEAVNFFKRYFPDINLDNFDSYVKQDKFTKIYEKLNSLVRNNFDYYLDLDNLGQYAGLKKQAVNFLKQFFNEVNTDNIEQLQTSGLFSELEKIASIYEEKKRAFDIECEKLKPYENYLEKISKFKETIFRKYYHQLIDEFSSYADKEELKNLDDPFLSRKNTAVFGKPTSLIFDLEAFSSANNQLLETDHSYRKDSIIDSGISYFKAMGINLGNKLEPYQNNLKCQQVLPPQEIIDQIVARKKQLYNQANEEYYETIGDYQEHKKRIGSLNLLCDEELGADFLINGGTAVFPNAHMENGTLTDMSILCYKMDYFDKYLDAQLIHELNHLFELELIKKDEQGCEFITGFDLVYQPLKGNKQADEEKREFELFSEIINELIAQSITTILHNNGTYIFNNKENAKIKRGTSYEHTFFLAHQFFDTYKEDIIISRRQNNFEHIINKVGADNFKDLNALFNKFYQWFPGTRIYGVLNCLQNNIENDDTKKLHQLQKERDEILKRMQDYTDQIAIKN